MNDITLSHDLNQIELEITHHKQIVGQSVWEIGRRLNHVKENNLTHGQFMEWLEKIEFSQRVANQFMRVAKELPNSVTSKNLGVNVLYLITTLPDEEKTHQLDRIEKGELPTVRELQALKEELKRERQEKQDLSTSHDKQLEELETLRQRNRELETQAPKVVEVEKVVNPSDYDTVKKLNGSLMDRNRAIYAEKEKLEEEVTKLKNELSRSTGGSDEHAQLVLSINKAKEDLSKYQKEVHAYQNITRLLEKGNEMLAKMGGLIYADEERVLRSDGIVGDEFDGFVSRGLRFFSDLEKIRHQNADVIEGEFK